MREVVVVSREHGLPYSKGLMAQSMMASGLAPERSYQLAKRIEERLDGLGADQVTVVELRALAEQVLAAEENEQAVRRFRDWHRLGSLQRPLIVLVGGATGTGKSTLATQLAHRLGVTRVSATDLIRQVLRAFFSHEFMPSVHYSSFDAGRAVRTALPDGADPDLRGFTRQAEHVAVGANAILERAVRERYSMVLEGVHLVPGLVEPRLREGGVVVEVLLEVTDAEAHRGHFHLRGAATGRQPKERYVEGFERIRKLQDYLVERAHESGVAVIESGQIDRALAQVMTLVLDAVAAADAPAAERAPVTAG